MNLSDFPPDLLALSDLLEKRIVADIAEKSGWISFADYMQHVLYAPMLGYYSGGLTKLGEEGDFTTAPEMTDLYGHTLAQSMIPLLAQTQANILELGAGSGKLAFDVLGALAENGIKINQYQILELSPELQQRQKKSLSGFDNVEWLTTLPERFDGVVLANEVLDAMPVHLVKKKGRAWYEMGVSVHENRLIFSEKPCGECLADVVYQSIPDHENLPDGYLTEVHLHAHGFIRTLSEMLCKGTCASAILIDYGFPAHEYYHPDRSGGTLMCHFRHRAHDDPFFLPGLQDVTSHLDFTSVAKTAADYGLDVICYASQSSFLLASGLPDVLLKNPMASDCHRTEQWQTVQKLLSPAEMGELFKVMVLGYKMKPPAFMLDIDKSGRL